MSFLIPKALRARFDNLFRVSLVRSISIILLLIMAIPVLIFGIAAGLRTQQLLRDQAFQQMQSTSKSQAGLINQVISVGNDVLRQTALDQQMVSVVNSLTGNSTDTPNQMSSFLKSTVQFNPTLKGSEFSDFQISAFSLDGKIIVSTNLAWVGMNISKIPSLMGLIGKEETIAIYDPVPLYNRKLVIFSTQLIKDDHGKTAFTLVASMISPVFNHALAAAQSFNPAVKAYFLTKDKLLIGIDSGPGNFVQLPSYSHFGDAIDGLQANKQEGVSSSYRSASNDPMIGYVSWLQNPQLGMIVEIPQSVVFEPLGILGQFYIILIVIALLLLTGVGYFANRQLVRPLQELTEKAHLFSQGDWSQRAETTRKDELGELGRTFNRMVEQLSELYRSLEQKVQERTKQVRLASEVAQVATSTLVKEEILQRTVSLVAERFGYVFAGIYLVDVSNNFTVLQELYWKDHTEPPFTEARLHIGPESLVGWVAANNQSHIVPNLVEETYTQAYLVEEAHSEVAIPIAFSGQVLGVLDVQSAEENGFDGETVSVLQTLANQIASSLQNIRLLEAAKINLVETSLLYRTSRQVAQAKDADEVITFLTNSLVEIPYVTGFYSIEEDHIKVLNTHDPKDRSIHANTKGVTLSLQNIAGYIGDSRLLLVDDLAKNSELQNILTFFVRRGCISAAIFPIHEANVLSKVIVIGTRETDKLTQTALQPFANLIEVSASTLSRFRILSTLEGSVNELQTLETIGQSISAETDPQNLFKLLRNHVTRIIGVEIGFLVANYSYETDQIEIPYMYERGEESSVPAFPAGEGVTSIVIKTQKPLMINRDADRRMHELGAKIIGQPAHSWMGIPLIVGGKVIGAMVIQDLQHEERFTQSNLRLLTTLAPHIASAVRNAQLLDQMSKTLSAYEQERFLLNNLLDNIPDQVYFKDTEGKFLRVSHSFTARVGLDSPDFVIGKTETDIRDATTAAQIVQEETEIIQSGESQIDTLEKQISADGLETWFSHSLIPMKSSAGITGLLGIYHNITDVKKAEEIAQRTAQELRTAAEIARDISSTLKVEDLLAKAVNLVRDRFGFYHASIFLLDPLGEFAVLRESTGDAGAQLKQAGHKLAVGSKSIVGQATIQAKALVINDVLNDPTYYPNPLLPDTRSELSIPMKAAELVIGALDVQSTHANAFAEEDISILQVLADQLAIAVENATLFARAQETLARHRLLHDITNKASTAGSTRDALDTTVRGLKAELGDDKIAIYLAGDPKGLSLSLSAGYDLTNPLPITIEIGTGIIGQVAALRQPVGVSDIRVDPNYVASDPSTRSELAVPILYRDNLLGVLNIESSEIAAYDEFDLEILATLGNSLGAILYNTQLVAEVRKQVERQQMIYDATSRIRRTVDIETILKTSTIEICRALGARRAHIEISPTLNPVRESPTADTQAEIAGTNLENNGKKNGKEVG